MIETKMEWWIGKITNILFKEPMKEIGWLHDFLRIYHFLYDHMIEQSSFFSIFLFKLEAISEFPIQVS